MGAELASKWTEPVSFVVSPAVGGLVIGYEVAKHLDVPFMFTERVNGRMELRRGFEVTDDDFLIVEDVVTSGQSAIATCRAVCRLRHEDASRANYGLMAIINRGGRVPYFDETIALKNISAPVWDESQCPLCAENVPIDTPGSRNLG